MNVERSLATEHDGIRVSCVLPTLNAEGYASALGRALAIQTHPVHELIVIDSSSDDGTVAAYQAIGARVVQIRRQDFNHGAVRNQGAGLATGEVLVFLTQDALPSHPEWLARLLRPLGDGTASASFSRQLPEPGSSPLARYAREANYPAEGRVVSAVDVPRLGIKAVFFSNSCSAIRASVFAELGGFPTGMIMNEDMLFAAKLLQHGHAIAYAADSVVVHSHDYSLPQTFRRYFDIGVVLRQAQSELAGYGLQREGLGYAAGLVRWLLREGHALWLPVAFAESGLKWIGVQLGKRYPALPPTWRKALSMHKGYWSDA